MKLVMLERDSLGLDIDVSCFGRLTDAEIYPVSSIEEAKERVKDKEVVITNKIPMNAETLGDAPNVKLVLETATGVNNIDLEYCRSRGIRVANATGYSTDSVAQHTFALALYLLEHMPYYDRYVKDGSYGSQPVFTHFSNYFTELKGKTWGIIGLGTIGRRVAEIAGAFGCRIIYYSASGKTYDVPYEKAELETLLSTSDIVSIHAPLNTYTEGLLNYDRLKLMKKSAYLINVGRGPIVSEPDLARALNDGLIAGAGIDVLAKEPIDNANPLLHINEPDKLIITPHLAWASFEARQNLVNKVCRNLERYLAGDTEGFIV